MAQRKTEVVLQQSKKKIDLHTRTDTRDQIYLDQVPSIQHVDLEVSKYNISPEEHKMVKHDTVEQSNSYLDEFRESSIVHIDVSEECGTILDARMNKLREEESTSTERPNPLEDESPSNRRSKKKKERICLICWNNSHHTRDYPYSRKAKRAALLLANAVEHNSNCTIKDDIMSTGKPPEVTPISQDPESQLKDVLF
ncbi:hypothetical protein R3W88_014924 [Solanum pinnatisectum]|uniref:Uncharacterized protein n=1 Tax=Solanum pinnatisectum TaxID=50273 RepID=A0AAV9KTG8_9SOLN|nr:hypothetical protein R3W88_014924 [Solanum pinnatisectum]